MTMAMDPRNLRNFHLLHDMLRTGLIEDYPEHFFNIAAELPDACWLLCDSDWRREFPVYERTLRAVLNHRWFRDWCLRNAHLFGIDYDPR